MSQNYQTIRIKTEGRHYSDIFIEMAETEQRSSRDGTWFVLEPGIFQINNSFFNPKAKIHRVEKWKLDRDLSMFNNGTMHRGHIQTILSDHVRDAKDEGWLTRVF